MNQKGDTGPSPIEEDMLQIEVRNFGPVAESKIDLRPLTVFVGPSNTGKSYMAILIYALHKFFSSENRMGGSFLNSPLGKIEKRRISENHNTEMCLDWLNEKFSGSTDEFGLFEGFNPERVFESIPLPSFFNELVQSVFDLQGVQLSNQIQQCFGLEVKGLIRNHEVRNSQFTIQRKLSKKSVTIDHRLEFSLPENKIQSKIIGNLEIELRHSPFRIQVDQLLSNLKPVDSRNNKPRNETILLNLIQSIADHSLSSLVGILNYPAFYLPADRTGVMHAHSVVVSAIIENASMTGLRPTPQLPLLSGVLADFLRQLIYIDSSHNIFRIFNAELAAQIEEDILEGAVNIEKGVNSGYPRFTYQPKGWNHSLPLMNASSMVSELAPIVLFLRHQVTKDNVLIVEEPESHLHPELQVKLTHQLATLVKSGIRVIVTTHSEWVLEALSNIVQNSKIVEHHKKTASDLEISLSPKEVGVWLFQPNQQLRGSIVEEIRIDDFNLYSSGFDHVAFALHNKWVEISNQIGDSE